MTEALGQVLDLVARLGPWGPVLFAGAYILSCLFLIPASILTFGAGAVYGLGRGFPLVWLSANLGAAAAFLVGRYIARDWVAARAARDPRWTALDEAVGREGWKLVALTRLAPVFPFILLNYALSLTRISFRDYASASAVGMVPGTLLFVYLGALAGDLARLGVDRGAKTPAEWAFTVFGLAATIAVTVRVSRLAREAMAVKRSQ